MPAKKLTVRSSVLSDQQVAKCLAAMRNWYTTYMLESEVLEITEEDCHDHGLTTQLLIDKEIEADGWLPFVLRYSHTNNWQAYRDYNRNIYLDSFESAIQEQAKKAGRDAASIMGKLVDLDLSFAETILESLRAQILARLATMDTKDMLRFYDLTMKRVAAQQKIHLEAQKYLDLRKGAGLNPNDLPDEIQQLIAMAKDTKSHSILALMASNLNSVTDDDSLEHSVSRRVDSDPMREERMAAMEQTMAERLAARRAK